MANEGTTFQPWERKIAWRNASARMDPDLYAQRRALIADAKRLAIEGNGEGDRDYLTFLFGHPGDYFAQKFEPVRVPMSLKSGVPAIGDILKQRNANYLSMTSPQSIQIGDYLRALSGIQPLQLMQGRMGPFDIGGGGWMNLFNKDNPEYGGGISFNASW